MIARTYDWRCLGGVHLADWAHGELSVVAHHEFLTWSVRLGKHPGLRVGGSTLYPALGETMAAKVEVAKRAAQGHAEAIEQVIADETARLREELADTRALAKGREEAHARVRIERDAALAREAALVAALEAITSWPLGDAGGMRTVAREALAAHHKGAPVPAEPPAPSAPDYIGASDPNRTRHCVPAEPPAPSADGELRAMAERVLEPTPKDWRLAAYYYSFDATGIAAIDRVLSAVACAGKSYHLTQDWTEEQEPYHDGLRGETPAAWIQNAANDAAAQLRALLARLDAPAGDAAYRAKVAALCEAVDAYSGFESETVAVRMATWRMLLLVARRKLLADHPEAGAKDTDQ